MTSARRNVRAVEFGNPSNFARSNNGNGFQIDDPEIRNWEPEAQSDEDFERELSAPNFNLKVSGLSSHAPRGYIGYNREAFGTFARRIMMEYLQIPIFIEERKVTLFVREPEILRERVRC